MSLSGYLCISKKLCFYRKCSIDDNNSVVKYLHLIDFSETLKKRNETTEKRKCT